MTTPHDQEYQPIATKALTISTSVVAIAALGFSAAQLAAATRAVMSVHNASVHYTYDGTAVSVTLGHVLQALAAPQVVAGVVNIGNLQFIREAAADAILTVTLETTQGNAP